MHFYAHFNDNGDNGDFAFGMSDPAMERKSYPIQYYDDADVHNDDADDDDDFAIGISGPGKTVIPYTI